VEDHSYWHPTSNSPRATPCAVRSVRRLSVTESTTAYSGEERNHEDETPPPTTNNNHTTQPTRLQAILLAMPPRQHPNMPNPQHSTQQHSMSHLHLRPTTTLPKMPQHRRKHPTQQTQKRQTHLHLLPHSPLRPHQEKQVPLLPHRQNPTPRTTTKTRREGPCSNLTAQQDTASCGAAKTLQTSSS
jgi:hypothetical protein